MMHLSRNALSMSLLLAMAFSFAPARTLLAAPLQQAAPTCLGQEATIVHIGYDGLILGTEAADIIVVDGGWNTVLAGGGDDIVCINGHFNYVSAEEGDDTVSVAGLHNSGYGNEGDDVLSAADDSNYLNGGIGDDRCNGDSC